MNLSTVKKEEHRFKNSYMGARRKETHKGSRKGERQLDVEEEKRVETDNEKSVNLQMSQRS